MKTVWSYLAVCAVLGVWLLMSGCAVNQGGTRKVEYGPDGLTITSETVQTQAQELVEIEKEKSVQTCWKEYGKANKSLIEAVKDQPLVAALIKQNETVNNALSLMKTGKNYNPCPSSTNSMDADIAESAMYTSIWHDGFGFAKFGVGMWFGAEIVDSVVGGLKKAGGMAFQTGDNSPITLTDAANQYTLGATSGGSSVSDLFNRTDNSMDILPAPEVDETLMAEVVPAVTP